MVFRGWPRRRYSGSARQPAAFQALLRKTGSWRIRYILSARTQPPRSVIGCLSSSLVQGDNQHRQAKEQYAKQLREFLDSVALQTGNRPELTLLITHCERDGIKYFAEFA